MSSITFEAINKVQADKASDGEHENGHAGMVGWVDNVSIRTLNMWTTVGSTSTRLGLVVERTSGILCWE
jgi:hypothetical protein